MPRLVAYRQLPQAANAALARLPEGLAQPRLRLPFRPAQSIGGTAISGLVGGLASVAGGGKFEDGAVTGAFGYLFNALLHATTIGNDAHQTLLDYALEQGEDEFFGNTGCDPSGETCFGGRPDLGNVDLSELWEVKTLTFSGIAAGLVQVDGYSWYSAIFGQTTYNPAALAPTFFTGNSLELEGEYADYTYTFVGAGVIGYTYNLDPGNFVIYGAIPSVRNAPKGLPFEFVPEVVPVP